MGKVVIGYYFEFSFSDIPAGRESRIEELLEASPVVDEFDVGRGNMWFEGRPGAELRSIKAKVLEILGEYGRQTDSDWNPL